jgi:hypothetical protein
VARCWPRRPTPAGEAQRRGQEWISIENGWDTGNQGYDDLGDSSPSELRDRQRGCGASTLEAVLDGAYEYLRLIEELGPVVDRMNERKNRLRDQEEKIFDFCFRHPQACESYERCRSGGGGER